MTKQQRTSTTWFLFISVGLTLISIISSQKLSQGNLSTLAAAAEQSFQLWQAAPETLVAPSQAAMITPSANATIESGVVKRVIDGDTFELETGQKVRLIGINTPELHHPQKGVECFGQEAYHQAQQLLEGKTVLMQKDVSETDRYGRLLRYVWVDSIMINQALVETGYAYATAYPPDVANQTALSNAQIQAQTNKHGLWTACPAEN